MQFAIEMVFSRCSHQKAEKGNIPYLAKENASGGQVLCWGWGKFSYWYIGFRFLKICYEVFSWKTLRENTESQALVTD